MSVGWPRSTVEKGPLSNESYERESPWNRTISTVLWVHKKLPQSTVKLVLPSTESYESKTGCNRTLATVLWAPLREIQARKQWGWGSEIVGEVLLYTSNLHCSTVILLFLWALRNWKSDQASHLYCSTPPMCIAVVRHRAPTFCAAMLLLFAGEYSGKTAGVGVTRKFMNHDLWEVRSTSSNSLSGMFRHSASPAIPYRESFAAIPSVSLVLLGHTNRSVSVSHESQREFVLV